MKTVALKLARIGNSRGVRLPADLIRRYGFAPVLTAEARDEGLLLKPMRGQKLSWEETAEAMVAGAEDWGHWDCTAADGLEVCHWVDAPAKAPAKKRAPPARAKRR